MSFAGIDINHIEDENVQRAFRQILDRLNTIGGGALANGTLVRDVALTTSSVKVPHTLGRKPRGYIVTKRNANAVVYNGDFSIRFLNLTASAAVTVDLWVF